MMTGICADCQNPSMSNSGPIPTGQALHRHWAEKVGGGLDFRAFLLFLLSFVLVLDSDFTSPSQRSIWTALDDADRGFWHTQMLRQSELQTLLFLPSPFVASVRPFLSITRYLAIPDSFGHHL